MCRWRFCSAHSRFCKSLCKTYLHFNNITIVTQNKYDIVTQNHINFTYGKHFYIPSYCFCRWMSNLLNGNELHKIPIYIFLILFLIISRKGTDFNYAVNDLKCRYEIWKMWMLFGADLRIQIHDYYAVDFRHYKLIRCVIITALFIVLINAINGEK